MSDSRCKESIRNCHHLVRPQAGPLVKPEEINFNFKKCQWIKMANKYLLNNNRPDNCNVAVIAVKNWTNNSPQT